MFQVGLKLTHLLLPLLPECWNHSCPQPHTALITDILKVDGGKKVHPEESGTDQVIHKEALITRDMIRIYRAYITGLGRASL